MNVMRVISLFYIMNMYIFNNSIAIQNLQINESLGLEMIFSLVSSAQEWLNVKWDDFKKEADNRAQQKLKEIEEEERVIFQHI